MARSYRASNGMGDGALPVLIVASLAAAAGVGALEGVVTQWFNLFIVFPLLIGAASATAAVAVIAARHIRAPVVAALIAGAAAVAGQLTFHAVSYERFRSEMATQLAHDEDGPRSVDDALAEHTGSPGFVGYAKLMAEQGTVIKHNGRDSGMNFTGTGWWILALVEALAAGGFGAVLAFGRANQPYCESCKRWFDLTDVEAVGAGDKATVATLKGALDSEAWPRIGEVLGTSDGKRVSSVIVRRCGQCQNHEPVLSVTVTTAANTKKPKVATVYTTVLRYSDYNTLHATLAKPAAVS